MASARSGTVPPRGGNSVTGQSRQAPSGDLALPAAGALAHDEEIARYYAEHRDKVRRWLVSGCGCLEADAEDIVQETILVIRRRYWPTVRALEKPEAYWFKIAGNRYRRTRGRQAGRTADGDPTELLREQAALGDQFAQADRRQALEQVIRQLPPRQRQVLWLRLVADFSEAGTAEILGLSTGSVKTHLNHAKTRMQKLMRMDSATWEAGIR
jgi:RNA polymerase sigma-70 factor (ECF subfamily)